MALACFPQSPRLWLREKGVSPGEPGLIPRLQHAPSPGPWGGRVAFLWGPAPLPAEETPGGAQLTIVGEDARPGRESGAEMRCVIRHCA